MLDENNAQCPVARALEVLGDRWALMILRDAFDGLRRFSEFQKNLGLAKNILTSRLKLLVESGLLMTQPASDGSAIRSRMADITRSRRRIADRWQAPHNLLQRSQQLVQ